MTIHISGQPSLVPSPAFAGVTIRVPLSEEPSEAWLDLLSTKPLPGKGHRVVGAALEFCLDRDSRDLPATMKRLDDAINATSAKFADHGAQLEERREREHEVRRAAESKLERQLAEWWSRKQPAGETQAPELTEGAVPETPSATDESGDEPVSG